MKRKILGLIAGFLFIGVNVFAADGDLTVDGNVGIGTTAPSYKLDVGPMGGIFPQTATSGAGGLIRNNAAADTTPYTQARIMVYGGAGVDSLNYAYLGYGSDAIMRIIYGNTTQGHALYIGEATGYDGTGIFTPELTVSGGNVGIGTTNPGGTMGYTYTGQQRPILDIVDSNNTRGHTWIRIAGREDLAPNQNQRVIAMWMHPSQIGNAGWYMGTDNTGNLLRFSYGASTTEDAAAAAAKDGLSGITINTSGNVGIGTRDPIVKFQVADTNGQMFFDGSSGASNNFVLNNTNLGKQYSLRVVTGGRLDIRDDTAGVERISILTGGNVGIGTTDPGGYRLYVAGTAYSTGGWQSSDLRYKENVTSIESPLNKILNIEGISFDWKKDEFKDKGFPEGRHYGVIAQRVERVLPEVVREGPGGEKSVSYTEIIPVLIEAMKEQQKTIEKQQKEMEELKTEINELRSSTPKNVASLQR